MVWQRLRLCKYQEINTRRKKIQPAAGGKKSVFCASRMFFPLFFYWFSLKSRKKYFDKSTKNVFSEMKICLFSWWKNPIMKILGTYQITQCKISGVPISCQNSRTLTTIVHQWSCFGLVLAFCLCVYIVDRKNNIFCVSKLHQSVVILWSPKHWFVDDDSAWFPNWVEDFSLVFSNS